MADGGGPVTVFSDEMSLTFVAHEWKRQDKPYIDHGKLDLRRMAETYVMFFAERVKNPKQWDKAFANLTGNDGTFVRIECGIRLKLEFSRCLVKCCYLFLVVSQLLGF